MVDLITTPPITCQIFGVRTVSPTSMHRCTDMGVCVMRKSKIWFPSLIIVILCVFLSACSGNSALHEDDMAQDEGHVIAYDFEPLTFYSFDSLTASIEEMRGNATEDIHNLGGIEHLYIPAAASLQELMLDTITVKERYVCIYYYLEELDFSEFETADEEEIARISNTVKLEWTRNEDGSALLANTVEQLSLTELFDGMYYYDITYPTQPDTVLARSFFWVHDGYMFNLDIPDELYMTIPAQASISSLAEWDFTELERIDLT